MGYVGSSVKRSEDPPLLSGTAQFVGDIRRPGMVHAAVLRSTQAHARILGMDTESARAHDGVLAVITFSDIAPVQPIPMRLAATDNLARALQYPLADDVVRYCGEPIAVVVARTRYEAEDALELIEVDYDFLDAVTDPASATASGAPLVHASVPGNVADTIVQEVGDFAAALAEADLVIEQQMAVQRHTGSPMETRGLVAEYDATTQELTVWGPTKVVHFNRSVLASLLGMEESRIRFIEPAVGGGFGIRGEFYPEDYLIPLLAVRLGVPVCWIEDRSEHLQSANHSREQLHDVRVAVRKDGVILGLEDRFYANLGAYVRTHGATVPSLSTAYLPGPYRIDSYSCECICLLSNKTPTGTYRAPGRFEATFVRERLMDLIADRLGLSRTEVRRRNLVPADAMPYQSGTRYAGHGTSYDSGDYPAVLDTALAAFGYDEVSAWCAKERDAGRHVGVGFAFVLEKSGMGPWEYGRVEVGADGKVTLFTGAANVGQGIETALGQIVADELGMRFEDVRVRHGDTAVVPYGMGSFAQRATTMAGNAAAMAAQQLRTRILALAASVVGVDADELTIAGSVVTRADGTGGAWGLGELFPYARPVEALPRGLTPGLSEEAFFHSTSPSNPYGVHLAVVEVDPGTGLTEILRYTVVYDGGPAVNPMLVEGQLVGGVAQGIGGALYEDLAYDEHGQLVSGTFMDYLIPTAMEVPPVEVILVEDPTPSPLNPLRLKGAGEFGTPGVGAAIANAVADALPGSNPTHLPLTPERVVGLAAQAAERRSVGVA